MSVLRFLLVLIFILRGSVWAQSGGLDPSFEVSPPPDGVVRAIALQSDGNLIIAGDFAHVGGLTRGRVARVTPQGVVDAAFATGVGANGTIRQVVIQTDGKIIIAGDFTAYNGVARGRIARLNTNGSLDSSFASGAGANGSIHAMAVTGSVVLVGGEFTNFDGFTRNRLASLSSGVLQSFNPTVDGPVYALAVHDGDTIIGGDFQTVGGQLRPRLARFMFGTTLDSSFPANAPNGAVRAIYFRENFDLDSLSLVIGGEFTALGSTPRNGVAFLNRRGEFHPGTLPSDLQANGAVFSIVGENLGFVFPFIVGGGFTEFGGLSKSGIVRIVDNSDFATDRAAPVVDAAFNSAGGLNGRVLAMRRASGRIYVGGEFTTADGLSRPYFARLYSIWGPNPPEPPPTIVAKTISEQHIYVYWGDPTNANGFRLERSSDGGINWTTIFTSSSVNGRTYLDEALAAGTTYSYRAFATNPNGSSAPSEIAVATTRATPWTGPGSIDPSAEGTSGAVHSTLGETVRALEIEPDGKIVLGGIFNSLHGIAANSVARLNPDWTVDPSFSAGSGASQEVRSIARTREGKFLVAGAFSQFQGTLRNSVARLSNTGALDTAFDPGAGAGLETSRVIGGDVDQEGRPIVFGSFSSFGETPSEAIVRLNEQGAVDSTFAFSGSGSLGIAIPMHSSGYFIGGSVPIMPGLLWAPYGRITAKGLLNTSFGRVESGSSDAAALLPDGSVIFAGLIPRPSDAAPRAVVRIKPDGFIDPAFECSESIRRQIRAAAVQPDGKVIIGGMVGGFAGNSTFNVFRLNADGTFDPSFDVGAGANATVRSIAVEDDGRIVVGGDFTKFNGRAVSGIVRLRGDPPPTSPPTTPGPLSASSHSVSAIAIHWEPVPGSTRYFLERSVDGIGNWVLVDAPNWQQTTLVDYGLPPGETRHYRLVARNAAGVSSYSPVATARSYTPFEGWNVDHGFPASTPATDDFDKDELPQLVEFALGRNPTIGDAAGALTTRVSGGMLELSFTKARSVVAYAVEASDDLAEWDSSGVEVIGQPEVTARVPASSDRIFLRLRVSIP